MVIDTKCTCLVEQLVEFGSDSQIVFASAVQGTRGAGWCPGVSRLGGEGEIGVSRGSK